MASEPSFVSENVSYSAAGSTGTVHSIKFSVSKSILQLQQSQKDSDSLQIYSRKCFQFIHRFPSRVNRTSRKWVTTPPCQDITASLAQSFTNTLTFQSSCSIVSSRTFFRVSEHNCCLWPSRSSCSAKHLATVPTQESTQTNQIFDLFMSSASLLFFALNAENQSTTNMFRNSFWYSSVLFTSSPNLCRFCPYSYLTTFALTTLTFSHSISPNILHHDMPYLGGP